jgi:hypothetical protein
MSIITDLFSTGVKTTVSSVLSGASDIIKDFKVSPDEALKANSALEQLKIQAETDQLKIQAGLEESYTKEMDTVNKTMIEESKSEHTLVWMWRPILMLSFAAILINNFIIYPYFKFATKIEIPSELFNTFLIIGGVTAAGRSWEKVQKLKNDA